MSIMKGLKMRKYILVKWPEIQHYMNNPNYVEDCYFDPQKNVWFIPEDWKEDEMYEHNIEGFVPEVGNDYDSDAERFIT